MSAYCIEQPNQTKMYHWLANLGTILAVDIKKTGAGPSYEIWEGSFDQVLYEKYPYHVSIYQRRESQRYFNYLNINSLVISGQGINTGEVRYLSKNEGIGVGVHCSTDVEPAP